MRIRHVTMGLLLAPAPAWACGGLFCNNLDPVDQAGEEIVFSVDDGTITTHVTLSYEGPSDSFAWVVPVPGVPELFVSSSGLFELLRDWTEPQVVLRQVYDGCQPWEGDTDTDADTDSDVDSDVDSDNELPGITVVSEAPVGPYDTVVLQAESTAVLVDWLQDNGYGVPDDLETALGPYLVPGTNFLALKLQKDKDVGDMAPLGMRYPGTHPAVPIQLTAVATVPDLPLTVYTLGEARGVPLSYLHVQLNPLALNWFSGAGSTAQQDLYRQRVAEAADEAGGHAFVTLYAEEHDLGGLLWTEGRYDTDGLATYTDPIDWVSHLSSHGFFGDEELLAVLRDVLPAPAGVDETSFYDSPSAYAAEYAAIPFDAALATEQLVLRIVEPRREAQEMLDAQPVLTRMQSALSAHEMTVDPTFGFNPDLPAVSRKQEAILTTDCHEVPYDLGSRTLALPGGYEVPVPSLAELYDLGMTTEEWLQERMQHVGLVVEQLSESGPPEVLADHTQELVWELGPGGTVVGEDTDVPRAGVETGEARGCGCASAGGVGPWWAAGALAWLVWLGSRRRA